MIFTDSSEVYVSATESSGVNLIIVTGDAYLQTFLTVEQSQSLVDALQVALDGGVRS